MKRSYVCVWRCPSSIHRTHHFWWCWYVRNVKPFLFYRDVIVFGRVWSCLCDGCRRYWRDHVEWIHWEIQIVETGGNIQLLSPVAVRHHRFFWTLLNACSLRLSGRHGCYRDYLSPVLMLSISGLNWGFLYGCSCVSCTVSTTAPGRTLLSLCVRNLENSFEVFLKNRVRWSYRSWRSNCRNWSSE